MKSPATENDIQNCVNSVPALLWRIDVVHKKVEYLNTYLIPGLGEKTPLLLRNIRFREEVILEEDIPLFESFMKSAVKRRASSIAFRIKLVDGAVRWLKISGSPNPSDPSHYNGFLEDITEIRDTIRSLDEKETRIGERIGLFEHPIILINFSNKTIFAANRSFYDTFGLTDKEIEQIVFNDLLEEIPNGGLESIYEEIIFHHQWNGQLTFRGGSKGEFIAETIIRVISREGRNLLWVSAQPIISENHRPELSILPHPQSIAEVELAAVFRDAAENGGITELLDTIRRHQPLENLADSILYSDVHLDQDEVLTYGVGPSFETLEQGRSYPYEGTIAENIIRFNLDSIIVDNTLKSIRPIDWALFIPQNVLSYYAKPFFEDGILRTVFIFCSQQSSVFSEQNTQPYEPLFPLIQESINICRRK